MRLFRVLTAVGTAVLLTVQAGCASADEVRGRELMASVSQFYEADLIANLSNMEVTAHLSRPDPGSCTVEVTAPAAVAGLTYIIHEDGILMEFRDLEVTLDPTGAARSAPLVRAASALSALLPPLSEEVLPTHKDLYWELSATLDGDGCTLLLDDATGLPAKLFPRTGEGEISLENFVFFG